MTDEEFVRANWIRAELCETFTGPYLKWCISLGGYGFTRASIPDDWAMSQSLAWSAAAEFTRERLEEIRQVQREIEWAGNCFPDKDEWELFTDGEWNDDAPFGTFEEYARDRFTVARILARLQRELADLQRGMRVLQP